MAKKRVHELAKELNLTNTEMVQKLQGWGYDNVKSHSSTLEEDQVRAVQERFRGGQKPATAKPSSGGVVIRRPGRLVTQPVNQPAAESAPAAEPMEAAAPPAPQEPEAAPPERAPEPAPVVPAPEPAPLPVAAVLRPTQDERATPAPVVAAPEAAPVAVEAAPPPAAQAETPAPSAAAEPPSAALAAEKAPAAAATPPPLKRPTANSAVVVPGKMAPGYQPRVAPPIRRPVNTAMPAHLAKGSGVSGKEGHVVVRAPDRKPASAPYPTMEQRAPQAGATAQQPEATPDQIVMRHGIPHSVSSQQPGRPTANQAVLVSRPVFITKRVTPTTQAQRSYPQAPGIKPSDTTRNVESLSVFSESGNRREVDLKGAAGKKGRPGQTRNEKVENYSKQDLIDLVRSRTYIPVIGRKKRPTKKGKKTEITEMKSSKKVISIEETITIRELSEKLGVKGNDIIRQLTKLVTGKLFTINQPLDFDTASLVATEHGWELKQKTFEISDFIPEVEDKPEDMKPRPPVVTVMGHVDHGKTSLLDAIRSARVAEGEAGGITQHIGAYSVSLPGKGDITFFDTPGHEAFSAMRSRGAQVTDLIILVVAADDGVQPQTLESIKHAKEAEVPIVVAINKIDKPGTNPDVVKGALAQHGLQPEDWGGDVPMIPLSARQKTNLDLLLENVLLQSEMLDPPLSSNPKKLATGVVIESKLDRGRGAVSTVLVQDGTLKNGDAAVCGTHWGRVRMMTDDKGKPVQKVTAGYPVQVVGLSGTPDAGEDFHIVPDEAIAKKIADHRVMKARETELAKSARITVEDLLKKTAADAPKELVVMVKADVQGSAEAVTDALRKLSGKKVVVNVISSGVGAISENDVNQAQASKAFVVGFNVKPDATSAALASQNSVKVKSYSIIYELLDDVRVAMEDLLEPIYKERALGKAEVRQIFTVSKVGVIAGCLVTEGKVTRAATARVVRDRKVVHSGKLSSLKRFKDDVKEVVAGTECGIGVTGIEQASELQAGDVLDLFEIDTIRQKLD